MLTNRKGQRPVTDDIESSNDKKNAAKIKLKPTWFNLQTTVAVFVVMVIASFVLRESPSLGGVVSDASAISASSSSTEKFVKFVGTKDEITSAVSPTTIQSWRNKYEATCSEGGVNWEKLQPLVTTTLFKAPASLESVLPVDPKDQPITSSRNVFLDLGSNVGDTIANVIGGGLPLCGAPPPDRNIKTMFQPMNPKRV